MEKIKGGNMKKILLAVGMIAVFSAAIVYAADAGTTAFEFLKFETGARAIAMGGAYSAIADDINSLVWNPAGMSQVNRKEASFTHIESVVGIRCEYLGYIHPISDSNIIGGSVSLLTTGDMDRYDEFDVADGTKFAASDIAASVSYCNAFNENISLGGTLKILSERLEEEGALGIALDAGMLYKLNDKYSLACVLQNIGPGVRFIDGGILSAMPMNVKLGAGVRLLDNKQLTLATDINLPLADTIYICLGAEYSIGENFAIRMGFNTRTMQDLGTLSGLSIGLGLTNVLASDMQAGFDYAFVPYGALGIMHRISFYLKI